MKPRSPAPLAGAGQVSSVLLALFVPLAPFAGALACNSIIGVTDLTLATDAGGGDGAIDIGLDDDDTNFNPPPTPATDAGPVNHADLLQVALGDQHTCARRPTGTVACWGDAIEGEIGSGLDADGGIVPAPVPVANVVDAVDIAAGRNHTCIARTGGTVACWGYNLDGQLGNGESGNRHDTPVPVSSLTAAVSVAAGGNFSCAVRAGGTVACWGGNGSGQLGTGDQNGVTTPVLVSNLGGIVSMAAGQAHACAVKNDGSVYCWGDGSNGQLGNGGSGISPVPVAVDQLPAAAMVTAGERSTCALTRTNSVYCWGANEVGQLGSGAANSTPNPRPVVVANLTDALAIAAGANHVCATRKTGAVVCWGDGSHGELGGGAIPDGGAQPAVLPVTGIASAIAVGAGGEHSCVATSSTKIQCWGSNERGQLGDGLGTAGIVDPAPVTVTGFP